MSAGVLNEFTEVSRTMLKTLISGTPRNLWKAFKTTFRCRLIISASNIWFIQVFFLFCWDLRNNCRRHFVQLSIPIIHGIALLGTRISIEVLVFKAWGKLCSELSSSSGRSWLWPMFNCWTCKLHRSFVFSGPEKQIFWEVARMITMSLILLVYGDTKCSAPT